MPCFKNAECSIVLICFHGVHEINIRELFTPSVRDASRDFSLIRPQGNLTLYKRKEKAKDRRTKGNRHSLVLQDKRSLHYIKRPGTK